MDSVFLKGPFLPAYHNLLLETTKELSFYVTSINS